MAIRVTSLTNCGLEMCDVRSVNITWLFYEQSEYRSSQFIFNFLCVILNCIVSIVNLHDFTPRPHVVVDALCNSLLWHHVSSSITLTKVEYEDGYSTLTRLHQEITIKWVAYHVLCELGFHLDECLLDYLLQL